MRSFRLCVRQPWGGLLASRSQGDTSVAPEYTAVGHDLDALILPGDINVENRKPDVEGKGCSGFTADACGSTL